MADTDLVEILRDYASEKKNCVGDYWSRNYVNDAADEIERLRAEVAELKSEIEDIYLDMAGEDS